MKERTGATAAMWRAVGGEHERRSGAQQVFTAGRAPRHRPAVRPAGAVFLSNCWVVSGDQWAVEALIWCVPASRCCAAWGRAGRWGADRGPARWSVGSHLPVTRPSFVLSVWRHVYPPSDTGLSSPVPGRRWHPALAVPAVVVATLFIPPLGAALAFMARWDKAGKAVTVVLASVWFGVLLVAGANPKPASVDAKPQPQSQPVVVVTVTAPAPAASAPVAASAAPTTPPPGSFPVSPQAADALAPPAPAAPQRTTGTARRPQGEAAAEPGRQAVADDGKVRTSGSAPAVGGSSSRTSTGGSRSSGSGGGSSVSYRNCTAVRQAGAAPIRRGDPGFGPHLDRDGDGVACE
ncbi:excalibur calcium-binding domain-containing protein [Streptomyces sp. NBC_01214]|uniref:excalibur calcium-binding domain-containing protein n=1 Tax=Streptomyces sp. NBC_01214 TaxID=2903777 RepID=UPI002B1E6223|nr:excalibur calcium-binding domain-containing protein [Streptomyces sp. NBC_01214]